MGIDRRTVIDSLRLDTQTIWLGLIEDEKRRFLRHLFRYWEIIRSRIPPESEAIVDATRASGTLDILAGRIRDLAESEATMEVHYVPRGRTRREVATGPSSSTVWDRSQTTQDRPSSGEEPDEAGADSSGPRASWRRSASKRRDHRAERCRVRGPVHARIDHEGRSPGGAGPRSESRQSGLRGCSSAAASLPRRPLQPV